jgi:alkylation response protein AidB-like acyl-CoA dehydrogenase
MTATRGAESWSARATAWIDDNPPPPGAGSGNRTPIDAAEEAAWRAWGARLHAAGLATMHWPGEYGGEDADVDEVRAVTRALRRAGAPLPLTDVAVNLVAPAIMQHGTPEQRQRLLPGIREGRSVWTQLFSEPGAGSDLASLRVRARREGDGFVVDGQKVWNTYAHLAEYGYLLARTGEADSRHRGLTMFCVPMDAPGITVRPIVELSGHADFNEVFFDGVRLGEDAVLGQIDGGWGISMGTLSEERRVVGNLAIGLEADLERVTETVDAIGSRADRFTTDLALIGADVASLISLVESDALPSSLDGAGKILFSEINIALSQLGVDLAAAFPDEVPAGWARRWSDVYRYARGYTISGGANEILRNVIARRGLGLPRS